MNYAKGLIMCGAVLAASAAITAAASPVEARTRPIVVTGPSQDVVTRRVSYRDLNLASLPGEQTLKRRVRGAVVSVCSEVALLNEDLGCRSDLWDDTMPQITRAVARARQIAQYGHSAIPAVAITVAFPR
jgi:UrcA family protein